MDFVTTYEAHTQNFLALSHVSHERALELAIGCSSAQDFDTIGRMQKDLLAHFGLRRSCSLVDVGCGSGRLAVQLDGWLQGPYIGTDVVQVLLDHARAIAPSENMRFERVTGLRVPAADNSVDFVCAFSVFTHLLHEESYTYMRDCFRALKPGGVFVYSFLEYRVPSHWSIMETNLNLIGSNDVHNQFLSVDAVEAWAEHLNFEVAAIFRGDEPFIPLAEPLPLNGRVYTELGTFGQSAAVLRKR